MRKEFLPYYLSRAALSAGFGLLVFGLTWKAALLAALFFCLFLLYLHSGWFVVDSANPLTPLRRDERAQGIQRKALIAAVVVGLLTYILQPFLANLADLPLLTVNLALPLAVLAYFVVQFVMLSRA